jgi:hypothetical protein
MISPTCDFKQFLDVIQNKPVTDIIALADHEATEAWRQSHREKKAGGREGLLSAEYHKKLVCLIDFMRYRVKTKSLPAEDLERIDSICQRVDDRESPEMKQLH